MIIHKKEKYLRANQRLEKQGMSGVEVGQRYLRDGRKRFVGTVLERESKKTF